MEDKNRQIAELQALVDKMEPVYLYLPQVILKWDRYGDRLSYAEAELLRLYKHSLKGEKESEGIRDMGNRKDADGEPEPEV